MKKERVGLACELEKKESL